MIYSPFGWLSFGVFGLLIGRWLSRRKRSSSVLIATSTVSRWLCRPVRESATDFAHCKATAVVLLLVFVATRLLNIGTFASRMIPLIASSSNPLLSSWKAFVYSSKYPPDLSYWTLWVGLVCLLYAGLETLPVDWAERTPFLEFGRAPFFFYVGSLSCMSTSVCSPRFDPADYPLLRLLLRPHAAPRALPPPDPTRPPRLRVLARMVPLPRLALVHVPRVREVQDAPGAGLAVAVPLTGVASRQCKTKQNANVERSGLRH